MKVGLLSISKHWVWFRPLPGFIVIERGKCIRKPLDENQLFFLETRTFPGKHEVLSEIEALGEQMEDVRNVDEHATASRFH